MCGIYASLTKRPLSKKVVDEIHSTQIHRGPDGFGETFIETNMAMHVSLLHQRLSIIDENGGSQPFNSNCMNYTIVFNGEIFNYKELRNLLKERGVQFRSRNSDTEVLLYMYIIFGVKMFSYLRGMWSFVIYDRLREVLFCARDSTLR